MLLAAFGDTIATLRRPYFFRMLWLSVFVTAAVFTLLGLIGGAMLFATHLFDQPFIDVAFDALALGSGMVVAWLLLPLVVPLIGVVFMEGIARRVAREEYGGEELRELPFGGEVAYALRFALVVLGLNILFLPLYVFIVFAPFLYYLLNGYLLGREMFELAGALFVGRSEASASRKRHSSLCLWAGLSIALMSTIPVLNLFAPFVGAALMVHLFLRVSGRGRSERLTIPDASAF